MSGDTPAGLGSDDWTTINTERRRQIILSIEAKLGGRLISYHENPACQNATIENFDLMVFKRRLDAIRRPRKGFLMLTSLGGDASAAVDMIGMCREKFRRSLTVIVPRFARGVATMVYLGADRIMMGDSSKLGYVDPLVSYYDLPLVSARSLEDAITTREREIAEDDPIMEYLSLPQDKLEVVSQESARAVQEAAWWSVINLVGHMLKGDLEHARWVAQLLSYGSARKVDYAIGHQKARDILGLNVEVIDPESGLWRLIQRLYSKTRRDLKAEGPDMAKVIETSSGSSFIGAEMAEDIGDIG